MNQRKRNPAQRLGVTQIALLGVICAAFTVLHIANITEDLNQDLPLFSSKKPDQMGFVALKAVPQEAKQGVVLIWAPENCHRDAGQRADQLVADLEQAKIPYKRTSRLSYNISLELGPIAYFVLRDLYRDMEQPIVILDKRYRANPGSETVIQYYQSLHSVSY